MKYSTEHAIRAVQIVENLMPHVSPHPLYAELNEVLLDHTRWHEAHGLFGRIRTEISLPNEAHKKNGLDALFACVAENAAKTAYNCSGRPAPFDNNSFGRLLTCEYEFLVELNG
ncbi:hypothetical protein [Pseudobythopirellula maris]|uniref:hypothetical protein n=1 Tax=Pseudobythopirellula maris TaxID=2527991 RepID=UPI0011B7DEAA|nr:hypothetical protein [Pseudobythopirellula maris]